MSLWWRAYSSARHDPKVQRLSGDAFKAWFNLLCLASEHDGILPDISDVAYELRRSEEAAKKLLDDFIERELLDVTDRGVTPHNWNGRQYKSDVSTPRVKRFRQRIRNVSETPSETETEPEADTDTEANASVSARTEARDGRSRTGTRLPDDWQPSQAERVFAVDQGLDPESTASRFRDYWVAQPGARGRKADWPATWRNWCRRDGDRPMGAAAVRAIRPVRGNDGVYEQLARIASRGDD